MRYAVMGSLRENLHSIAQIGWNDKLTLLLCIISDLQAIHSKNIIHRVYNGNISTLSSAYVDCKFRTFQ